MTSNKNSHRRKSRKIVKPMEVQLQKFIDGKDIRHIRIDLDLDQADLAREMGIATATLSRIENNKNLMSRPYFKLLRYTVNEIETRAGKKCNYKFAEI